MDVNRIKIRRGLRLPVDGEPEQAIYDAVKVSRVAVMAGDFVGLRPRMQVEAGDSVKRGQLLFEDKKTGGVRYTAPAAGTVAAVNRGERRALQSVVIEVNDRERSGDAPDEDQQPFSEFTGNDPAGLSDEQIKALLLESGLWTAFRARPFGKVADPAARPNSIFVTAMDTQPLAASPDEIIKGNEEAFEKGLLCVAKLTQGAVFLCRAPGSSVTAGPHSGVYIHEFEGPHPAGTVGVHIHHLDPVHRDKLVWHLNYQDVVAIGTLFTTGKLDVTRVVSLGGPGVKRPRLLRTRLGASINELVEGELNDGDFRVISGSVFTGRAASGAVHGYLGRYHGQVSVVPEGRDREFLGWLAPGAKKFSLSNTFLAGWLRKKRFRLTTAVHGAPRAIVPIGLYERVMPIDVIPTLLLRALACDDIERAEELGCLELDEEDLALCSFVCPSKYDYGAHLRRVLTQIEEEG